MISKAVKGDDDYDTIDRLDVKKYYLLHGVSEVCREDSEAGFEVQLHLHLNPECNYC